jgi:hypothetical protein
MLHGRRMEEKKKTKMLYTYLYLCVYKYSCKHEEVIFTVHIFLPIFWSSLIFTTTFFHYQLQILSLEKISNCCGSLDSCVSQMFISEVCATQLSPELLL